MVERLRERHRVVLFAPGQAYEPLRKAFRGTEVPVHRLRGLRFRYGASGGLAPLATASGALAYLRKIRDTLAFLGEHVRRERPDLVITDFEPALPRTARREGIPFLSLDHQHFLTVNDLSSLPLGLRAAARAMALVVRAYYQGQVATVVSSFCAPPLKPGLRQVYQVGPLLRPEIRRTLPRRDGFLLVYLRRGGMDGVLSALKKLDLDVRVYGAGERPAEGRLTFRPIGESEFLADMAACEALVTTAGNQVVGEALHLGKPVLALPEPGNFEQAINAHFLRRSGAGDWADPRRLDARGVETFLNALPLYRDQIASAARDGTAEAVDLVERQLAGDLVSSRSRETPRPGGPVPA
jgi:uncharacterized protein (TIGR00661 family)